ncbi:nonribosomal peptide synthetase 10 [Venturia nashicola]|uniref:Nonribosomal peptide synthetase 10 n=1 Tax=Venturia nashicola TaxID=86259 RepID=A0A4Z1NZ10_9PEZI|nr:nonribosomal peptide synthetase 10 [Venturia nashicola]TLD29558.1 nonribosomal peptide synthetase 10 [Venturia nashicola]
MPIIDTSQDLAALFSKQVRATPDAIALESPRRKLTYAELDEKVEELSQKLRNQYGVGRDSLVGVLLGRRADYVITCLAALRAGGAFLVLELANPPAAMAEVIADAQPTVIVTHEAHLERLNAHIPLIILDEENPKKENGVNVQAKEPSPPPANDDLDRLAFVSYSSGTTGKPKGIANPHQAPVLSYDLRFGVSDLKPGDRVACNVFFIWEILRPLLRGAATICIWDEVSYDPIKLVDVLASEKVTETLMTPTLLELVLSQRPRLGTKLPELRTLWLNGEVVSTDLARKAMKALPNVRLLNCYSASETHEVACGDIKDMMDKIDSDATYCPVGPPLDPKHTYILDENKNPVEPGTSGELFVGGPLLARGYLNQPETTAKAFLPDPFDDEPGARMYRTGDLARVLPSGFLEITGRVGGMIKIRGYSVVPEKVAHAIVRELAVKHCTVTAHGEGNERQLVAYFVRDTEEPGGRIVPTVVESGYSSPVARKALVESLKAYEIPAIWMEVDQIPTNAVSGKIDLKGLPVPTPSKMRSGPLPSGTQTRDLRLDFATMAEMWATTLHVQLSSITPEHDFFDLGGHSLTLANLAGKLSRTFGFPISLARLASNPTVEGHLEVVRETRDGHTAAVQADLPAVLRADATLSADIQPKNTTAFSLSEAKTVLLTGATGFLGAFLLHDLLETTSAKIVLLVRFSDPAEDEVAAGMRRIRRNLIDLGLWRDSLLDRIEILPGNLSRKRLGLSPTVFEELASRVQVIIHAAATVNLVYPYAMMRGANVEGTREIVKLACLGPTLVYISTNGVLPPSKEGWPEDAMLAVEDVPTKLADGYGQTKWVAEQLVVEAGRRGLPVKVLRAGTISGHSTWGSSNAWDLLTAILVEALHLGRAPQIEGWLAEMTPVDYISKAILTLANNVETKQTVFHLGDPTPVDTTQLFKSLNELGYPTEPLDWEEWIALWTEKRGSARGGENAANPNTVDILRGGMPEVKFLKEVTVLNNAATDPLLKTITRPTVDTTLLETYARNWCARGWLPRPPRRSTPHAQSWLVQRGPLGGKVAVVTGASSGIGAAVAAALAKEGVHVALAARRTDELESIKTKLSAHGVKIIAHKTDVTQKAQVESLMKAAAEELGPVDILISCAGVMYFTMMKNVHSEEWERTVDVNCKGLLHCLSSTIPSMLSRSTGHIVAISSDAGRKVFPGLGVYSASKFFVEATLQALRVETAGSGLRVTSIQPGNVATDLLGMSTDKEALEAYGTPTGAKVLDADDVANSIIYALKQPEHVGVNEVMIEPREEPC